MGGLAPFAAKLVKKSNNKFQSMLITVWLDIWYVIFSPNLLAGLFLLSFALLPVGKIVAVPVVLL